MYLSQRITQNYCIHINNAQCIVACCFEWDMHLNRFCAIIIVVVHSIKGNFVDRLRFSSFFFLLFACFLCNRWHNENTKEKAESYCITCVFVCHTLFFASSKDPWEPNLVIALDSIADTIRSCWRRQRTCDLLFNRWK